MAPSISNLAIHIFANTMHLCIYVYACYVSMYIQYMCVCVRLIHLHLATPLHVIWSHLSCLSLTHSIYLKYPLPTLPERCHSYTRLTADIIKAVWPPGMLLAQSRNADRHSVT